MITRVLFGVQDSPQHKVCVALAWMTAILGIGVAVMQGWTMGVPVVLVGLLAVAVLSRQTATHHEKTATRDQLTRVTTDCDDAALRRMVAGAPHDPNDQLASVTGFFDANELKVAVAQVRG